MTSTVRSQSFLLETYTIVPLLFLPSRWQASILSPEIFTSIWCRILQTGGSSWSSSTEEGMPTISTLSQRQYCAFFQHSCSTEISCLTKASFTFLTTTIFDSSFWKLRFISLISSVRVFIVLLFCSWVFGKSWMSCILFKGCNFSSV